MGNSLPPAAAIDLVGSYARRRGGEVEVVLADPKVDDVETPAVVTLTKGGQQVEAVGELLDQTGGRRLTVRAPRDRLSDGIWNVALRRTGDDPRRLEARLLVQGERPLVLLWGDKTPPSLVPGPRTNRPAGAVGLATAPTKKRAAAAAGRAVDKALTVLPESTARSVRSQIRRTARKVLR